MQDAESLARAFFDANEKISPGHAKRGNIPILKWEELPGSSKHLRIAVCVEVLQNKGTTMQDAESLALAFFDTYEKLTFANLYCYRGNIPIRKWEELPESGKHTLIAVCVEVLENWKPRRPASV